MDNLQIVIAQTKGIIKYLILIQEKWKNASFDSKTVSLDIVKAVFCSHSMCVALLLIAK